MKIDKNKISYVLGQSIGGDFRRKSIDVDVNVFFESFKDALNGEEPKMRPSEMQHVMMNFQEYMKEEAFKKQQAAKETNIKKGKDFLSENAKNDKITTTESGLQYEILVQGDGQKPLADDSVITHYEGRTIEGNVFDSSYKRGNPAKFPLNGVIQGWQEALQLMTEGSKWEIYVPHHLAYGESGSGGMIGPYETLIFTIELIAVDK